MMRASLSTTNFRKKAAILGAAGMILFAAGCGAPKDDDVKVIRKDTKAAETVYDIAASQETGQAAEDDAGQTAPDSETQAADTHTGYSYRFNETEIFADSEAAPVLEALGEAKSYFEAPSCAFEGLDKVYSYDHFEINTYPENDKDYIAAVILLDDIVETKEGIAIGASKDDVLRAYGDGYEEHGASWIYKDGGTGLTFVFDNDTVAGIAYDSLKLSTMEEGQ